MWQKHGQKTYNALWLHVVLSTACSNLDQTLLYKADQGSVLLLFLSRVDYNARNKILYRVVSTDRYSADRDLSVPTSANFIWKWG